MKKFILLSIILISHALSGHTTDNPVTDGSLLIPTLTTLKNKSQIQLVPKEVLEQLIGVQVARVATRQSDLSIPQDRSFRPYAEKLIIPTEARVFYWGDLHGEVDSLAHVLWHLHEQGVVDENFMITAPDAYFIFLGDVVDRGAYGVETMYLLLRLMSANPDTVRWVRGNHEDIMLNVQMKRSGFIRELYKKYGSSSRDLMYRCAELYESLPPALFLGRNAGNDTFRYTLCVHGGLELGYNPKAFLASDSTLDWCYDLRRADMLKQLNTDCKKALSSEFLGRPEQLKNFVSNSPMGPMTHGFMWSDFDVDTNNIVRFNPSRGWIYGQGLTKALLSLWSSEAHVVTDIMRAHQHHGTMLKKLIQQQGLVSLWDNLVHTVLSAPVKGSGFNYYAYVERQYGSTPSMKQHIFAA